MTSAAREAFGVARAIIAGAATALALGAHCPAAHARTSTFQGVAGLCTVDQTGVRTEQEGGVAVEYGARFRYRIETDHQLVNGWETLISNTRRDPGGQVFYFVTASLQPDDTPGSTLEGEFSFPAGANPIKGSYVGTRALSSVVVHYELVPDPGIADAHPELCGKDAPLFGYRMYGSVENYD